jgi:hypothetical protein
MSNYRENLPMAVAEIERLRAINDEQVTAVNKLLAENIRLETINAELLESVREAHTFIFVYADDGPTKERVTLKMEALIAKAKEKP